MIALMWMSCAPFALGEDDDHEASEEHEEHEGSRSARSGPDVEPVTDDTWRKECGACHLAYPPGLLPARSWERLLGSLESHFGDDASVDASVRASLARYALAHAADRSTYRLSSAIARASAGSTPARILDIGWLREEHAEIPERLWRDAPAVRSLSNCAACHTGAAAGRFDEHEVQIPRSPVQNPPAP